MEKSAEEKNLMLAMAATIGVFCLGQIPGSIDAAISKISIAFNLSSTSGMYMTTVACLVSVAFSVVLGMIAGKKVSFRTLILFCATVELVTALVPFLVDNFVVLVVLRGLFGIGFGGMQSMETAVTTALIPPHKRAALLGAGMSFGFGANCVLQLLGGVLADIGWNYTFLNHLLLLIPYAVVVVACFKLDFNAQHEGEGHEAAEQLPEKLSLPIYQTWVLMLLVGVFIAPLLVGASFLSEQIIASAFVAGVVCVCFSVGCMVGGAIYPKLYERLGFVSLPVFLLLMAAGIAGCGLSHNIVGLCVAIFFAGVGFSTTQACCMMVLTLRIAHTRVAFSAAIMMALFNLGMFLSSEYEEVVGMVCGDALYAPLFFAAVVLVVLAVFFVVVSPLRERRG